MEHDLCRASWFLWHLHHSPPLWPVLATETHVSPTRSTGSYNIILWLYDIISVLIKWDMVTLQICMSACWKVHPRFSWKAQENRIGSFQPTMVRKWPQLRLPGLNIPTGKDGQQRCTTAYNHSWGRVLTGDVMQFLHGKHCQVLEQVIQGRGGVRIHGAV